jgi:hypothetical protein
MWNGLNQLKIGASIGGPVDTTITLRFHNRWGISWRLSDYDFLKNNLIELYLVGFHTHSLFHSFIAIQ